MARRPRAVPPRDIGLQDPYIRMGQHPSDKLPWQVRWNMPDQETYQLLGRFFTRAEAQHHIDTELKEARWLTGRV